AIGSVARSESSATPARCTTRYAAALSWAPNGTAPSARKPSAKGSKCSGSPASSPDTPVTLSPAGGRKTTRTNDPWTGTRGHQATGGGPTAAPWPAATVGTRHSVTRTKHRNGDGMGRIPGPDHRDPDVQASARTARHV